MHRHTLSILVVAAALAGCNTQSPAPQSSDKPAQDVAAEQAAASEKQPSIVDPGETAVPFVMTVKGPDTLPDSGEIELVVRVTAQHEFKVPGTLKVELPTAAKLVSGSESESLATIPAGETRRTFKVAVNGKLGPGQQIKVVLDARAPSGAMGAHSEQLYPETPKPTRPSSRVPPPPIARPVGIAPSK